MHAGNGHLITPLFSSASCAGGGARSGYAPSLSYRAARLAPNVACRNPIQRGVSGAEGGAEGGAGGGLEGGAGGGLPPL